MRLIRCFVGDLNLVRAVPPVEPVQPVPDIVPTGFVLDPATGIIAFELPQPPGTFPAVVRTVYMPFGFDQNMSDEDIWNAAVPVVDLPITGAGPLSIVPPADLPDGHYNPTVIAGYDA